ncbi:MAG: tetratricopeptide repeat protein [Marinoscillum sp.]
MLHSRNTPIVCVLFFIFSIHQVTAQTNLKKRIDSLNKASFELRVSDRQTSIAAARSAMALSRESYPNGLYEAYLNLGINYVNINKFDSAFFYLRSCADQFDEKSLNYGLSRYYLGINFSNLRDFKRATAYFDEAAAVFNELENHEYLSFISNSLGIIEGRQGNYNGALKYFLEAYQIKLDNNLDYDEELANISIVYRLMGNYEASLDFAQKSLMKCIELGDSLGISQTYITIGKIYVKMGKYDSSHYYFDQAIDFAFRNGYTRHAPSALINKSEVYYQQGFFEKAIKVLKQSIEIAVEEDDVLESAFYEMAKIYGEIGQVDSAIFYANKSMIRSTQSSNLPMMLDNMKLLSAQYKKSNEADSVIRYLELFIQYSDSLHNRNNQNQLADLRVRIETLEKENEIASLNQQHEVDRLRRQGLILLLCVVLVIGSLMVFFLIFRHKSRTRLQEMERKRLMSEIEKSQENLYRQTLHMIHVNNCLDDIEAQVKGVLKDKEPKNLKSVLNTIRVNKSLDKDWENFNRYFGSIHKGFFEHLDEAFNLTFHEQRACALIKLKLTNREIATILNIEPKSVVMLKYRIKKKLELSEEVELADYVNKL